MNDMKDRQRHGVPKIVVRAIRTLAHEGVSYGEIAGRYGITASAVGQIVRAESHKETT